MRAAVEDPDGDQSVEGVTQFRGRQYELDEIPGVLAETTGCHCCCHHGPDAPADVTINVHGSILAEKDLIRIVREQIENYRRRNSGPSREA